MFHRHSRHNHERRFARHGKWPDSALLGDGHHRHHGRAARTAPAPQIVLAMENLRRALHARLAHGPVSDEQADAVATVIDTLAAAINRGAAGNPAA